MFIDLNCFHRRAMWPMGLLFTLLLSSDVELNPGHLCTHNNVFEIFHLNIRSIRNKKDDLFTTIQVPALLFYMEIFIEIS